MFFNNIGSIFMYSFLGTFIAIITSTCMFYYLRMFQFQKMNTPIFSFWEAFAFSSLISATDPVSVLSIFKEMNADINLYSLIFGESIMNDAICIVMYWSVVDLKMDGNQDLMKESFWAFVNFCFVFIGSFVIGAVLALIIAYLLKKRFHSQEREGIYNVQILLLIITPWVSYLIAEGFEFSGIVSILCNGIFLHIYAAPNIPWMARKALHIGYETAVYTCETLVFLFLGLGVFAFKHPFERSFWITIYTVPILNISWAFNITITTWIINKFSEKKISKTH